MKRSVQAVYILLGLSFLVSCSSCRQKSETPSADAINAINLKKGAIISCGPPDKQFGIVEFATSCTGKVKKDLNLAVSLLHSFEYDEAEKAFAKVIDEEPGCAMAYWGVAMSNYHPLWAPPGTAELEKGAKAIAVAQSIQDKSKREADYINAIGLFYKDHTTTDHATRCRNFEKAMEQLYKTYPEDKEAAIFYALALDGTADPADKTFANQKKAGSLLTSLAEKDPDHPGIIHYIIHSYDYPGLAQMALPAAKKYASIAASSAHAQHMPSHIFVRLGLWDECIQSNTAAAASAVCYAEATGIKAHWDEELHTMDYLMYAYLQKGDNKAAQKQWDYLKSITEVQPANFKVAYAFAAIPSRYVLENKLWQQAAVLETHSANIAWQKFPWQRAILHFTRAMGLINTSQPAAAKTELQNLQALHDTLLQQKDKYKAGQVEIQINTVQAWMLFKDGKINEALKLMEAAANMEDNTQKMAVTPGEVIPARELLADMYMQTHDYAKALEAYEADLEQHRNRFNGLYGAGVAAEKFKDFKKTSDYYTQLLAIANASTSDKPELAAVRMFLKKEKL